MAFETYTFPVTFSDVWPVAPNIVSVFENRLVVVTEFETKRFAKGPLTLEAEMFEIRFPLLIVDPWTFESAFPPPTK
jgi:hypothetical protein